MSVLELLTKWGFAGGRELIKALEYIIAEVPDLAPEAQRALDELNAVLSPEALTRLGTTVVAELGAIGSGRFDGRRHPSDLG